MPYENYTALHITVDGGVATLSIDNGDINLFDATLIGDLARAGMELEADPAVKVIVLQSANPDFFIAHADVNLIKAVAAANPPPTGKPSDFQALIERFRSMPKVTIAKIAGKCRGGGSELSLACDMRFAALGKAVLCQPEVGVGIIPGGGASTRLPRIVGRGRALEIILGCGDFPADVAERYGYINRALPANELDDFVDALARRIAGFPTEAIAQAKAFINAVDRGMEEDLVLEDRMFLESIQFPSTLPQLDRALAAGLQTAEIERNSIETLWAASSP